MKVASAKRMLMLTTTLCVAACTIAVASPDPMEVRLISLAEELLGDYDLPGITIAVASANGLTSISAGLADRETAKKMAPDTTMLAASIGKTLVAATVLALWGSAFLSGSLLSANSYKEALDGVSASKEDLNSFYGLGISIRINSPWGPVYGHRGWIPGYVSSFLSDVDV